MKKANAIKQVLIEEGADHYPQTSRILHQLKDLPRHTISEDVKPNHQHTGMDKTTLRLIPFHGSLFKPCPGTKGYICCGYKILHIGTNCPLNCTYCILQAYFNQPSLRIFVNLEEELQVIGQILDSQPTKRFRVGTGEFTDSLALDPITHWSHILGEFVQKRKNAILEFKTKTTCVEGLLSSPHRDRIIVSWSLNSPMVASREEHGAPSIQQRLAAAKHCQAEGYALGFHFDPMIHSPDWKEQYSRTIDLMDRYIDPKGIVWMSMGCFRYTPALKKVIRKRHPETHILDAEFITGLDGKQRYFKPIRIEMYAGLQEIMNQWHDNTGVYLCMESDEVWRKGLGWSPHDTNGLINYLDNRVTLFFKM
jgi:spore photoproduct lyase